ncbi:MAG TPA: hypothetical protein VGH23_20545 [Rhizomicrobium sp.]|jgi:hypothetical protein
MAVKIDDDILLALIYRHFNEQGQKLLTFTRWKDSIDVQYLFISGRSPARLAR